MKAELEEVYDEFKVYSQEIVPREQLPILAVVVIGVGGVIAAVVAYLLLVPPPPPPPPRVAASSISASISPLTPSTADRITVTGTLFSVVDTVRQPLAGRSVDIIVDGMTVTSVPADASGKFSATFGPLREGSHSLEASFGGDTDHAKASTVVSFSVTAPKPVVAGTAKVVVNTSGSPAGGDSYARQVALSVDKPLNVDFWLSQPELTVGIFVVGNVITKTFENLAPGSHTLYVGVSSVDAPSAGAYPWHVAAIVNDVPIGEGDVTRFKPFSATFNI